MGQQLGVLRDRFIQARKRRPLSTPALVAVDAARPAVSAAGSRNRRRDIQGLRAVAVLMVVAFHAGLPVPGGFVGVDVFFVISGFVITAMLMREWDSTGRIRLGRFYVRRFKRLTPALALTVAVVMLVSFALLSPFGSQESAAKTAIGAMLLAANVVIARTTGDYFDAPAESNPLLNTWSLSVEEQFYLVFPAILLFGWLLGRRAGRSELAPVVVVGVVGVISFALALAGSMGLDVPLIPEVLVGFYGPATRAWEFAAGALVALGGPKLMAASRRLALPLAAAGAGMLIASLWLITGATIFPGAWTLLPVAGTLFLLAAGSGNTFVARGLASGPMVAIGDRSYSIYLWHWPFIVFAGLLWPESPKVLLAAAVLSLIPAYASYRWIEQPIRALPQDRGIPLVRLVAAVVIPPLALAGTLGPGADESSWYGSVRKYEAAIQPAHAGEATGCTDEAWRNPAKCTWNEGAAGQPIYLAGDSHADHFSEALILAAKSASRPLVGLSENGCAYLPVSLARPDMGRVWESKCMTHHGHTQDYLVTADPGLVVIANSYWWFHDDVAVGRPGEHPSQDPEIKRRALASGLTMAIQELQKAGHTVLVVQSVPQWGRRDSWSSLPSCSMVDMAIVGCSSHISMAEVRERQGAVADVVSAVARETGVVVLDVSSELCPDGTCSAIATDGLVRYRDGGHITVDQSVALSGTFDKAIAAMG